jgi:hypothetical protein
MEGISQFFKRPEELSGVILGTAATCRSFCFDNGQVDNSRLAQKPKLACAL